MNFWIKSQINQHISESFFVLSSSNLMFSRREIPVFSWVFSRKFEGKNNVAFFRNKHIKLVCIVRKQLFVFFAFHLHHTAATPAFVEKSKNLESKINKTQSNGFNGIEQNQHFLWQNQNGITYLFNHTRSIRMIWLPLEWSWVVYRDM